MDKLTSAHLVLVVMSTVATPGEWQCKIRTGGVRRLAVANGANIFQMLLVLKSDTFAVNITGISYSKESYL